MAKEMLSSVFTTIDVHDQINLECQWNKLKSELNSRTQRKKATIGHMYVCPLNEIAFKQKYNCIYMNWGLCYLTDTEIAQFLVKVKAALSTDNGKHGMLICKETTRKTDDSVDYDPTQRMYIRTKE